MGHTLKLLRGDKQSPTESFDLAEAASTSNVFLRTGGFAPRSGVEQVQWSGRTARADGQTPLGASRDNTELTITYDLRGDTAAELAYLQREINRYLRLAYLRQVDRIGDDIWLEYRWGDDLGDIDAPVWGQLSYYYRILWGEVPTWPQTLHSGALNAGNIEGVVANLVCEPYAEGLQVVAGKASGTITNEDNGTGIAASASITHTLELDATMTAYTIAGWISPAWASTTASDVTILTTPDSTLVYTAATDKFTLTASGSEQSFAANADIHLALVQGASTLKLYVNGAEDISDTTNDEIEDGETVVMAGTAIWDGWRIWDSALTATQIDTLYDNETPVKDADGMVGPVPYVWTKDGDNVVDNCDDATRDNWCIVGGVAGDVAAQTRWELDVATSGTSRVTWLGRKAQLSKYTPNQTHWIEYNEAGGSNSTTYDFDATLNEAASARGRVQVLGGFYAGDTLDVYPYFRLGSSERITGDTVSIGSEAASALQDFGDLLIDWPQSEAPATLKAGVVISQGTTANTALTGNLAAYWTMNETTGNRVDRFGRNNLTPTSCSYGTGVVSNGLDPTGGGAASCSDSAEVSIGDANWSMSLWVKFSSVATDMYIAKKMDAIGGETPSHEFMLWYNQPENRLTWTVYDSSSNSTSVEADELGDVSTGTWYHIVCWHDATNNQIGIAVNNGTADTAAHTTGVRDGSMAFGISNTPSYSVSGIIDEVGIWDEVLSSAKRELLYNGGAGMAYSALPYYAVLDFLQLLPYPMCRVECEADTITIASGDTLVIDGREAWMEDASDSDSQLYWFEHRGDEVTCEPGHYNYVFLLQGEEGEAYTTTLTATVAVYLTPRWLLPGGAVA